MAATKYDPTSPESIFGYSLGLLGKSLAEALKGVIDSEEIDMAGKGGVGQLVEKFYFGYTPNNSPLPDFPEAGVELKCTPLKTAANGEYAVKERLICDMIDYNAIVKVSFEESAFYRKSLLMLIMFYLHASGVAKRDLRFIYSVLWRLTGKDLEIIRQDYELIVSKIRAGKAHELSEGDTMYLGAARKGQKGDAPRSQPFSDIKAYGRAFSLKMSYMRTILDFVRNSGNSSATNTEYKPAKFELVSLNEIREDGFEGTLRKRFAPFVGKDYRQIARKLGVTISAKEKNRYARAAKGIMLEGLKEFSQAEEIAKAGICAKTIRMEADGRIRENMSFENIDYNEIFNNDNWTDSRWYEIATSKFMFIIFREDPNPPRGWKDEKRYVFDRVVFWTMPAADLERAREYWENIRANVMADTLLDSENTFWRQSDRLDFHVRPKAQKGSNRYISPVSGKEVPRKCYWFNREYLTKILNEDA